MQIAAQIVATGKSLQELVSVMPNYPQVLVNVSGVDKTRVHDDEILAALVVEAEAELQGNGRVLLRASGTESLVRVMVEASEAGTAQSWADRIARVVEQRLAL